MVGTKHLDLRIFIMAPSKFTLTCVLSTIHVVALIFNFSTSMFRIAYSSIRLILVNEGAACVTVQNCTMTIPFNGGKGSQLQFRTNSPSVL
jgi:hypothetical protein